MKKFTFLSISILLLSITIKLKSQDYIPFPPDPTSEWRIDEQWWNPDPWETTTYYYRMYFDGEVQIGDMVFHELWATGERIWNPPNGAPPVVSTITLEYIGRICTYESKVYFNFPDNLLFDYSWQVGDTVKDCVITDDYCYGSDPIIISSIDSLEINGRYHRRYNFEQNYGSNITWFIEGIGHENGIFQQACMTPDHASYFECYAENGEPIFPEDANCILTVGMDEPYKNDLYFDIYPNPASAQVTISMNSFTETIASLNVSDLTGRVLIHDFWKQNQGNNTISLDLSNLKPGIYFVTISCDDPTTTTQKKLIIK